MTTSLTLAAALALSPAILGCAGGPPAPGAPAADALSAGVVANDFAKYEGKKVRVKGLYAQGYSNGGGPTDPWALVIKDEPKAEKSVSCLIPATEDRAALSKAAYPKITVEGTVQVDKGDPPRINLTGCTWKLD